MNTYHNLAEEIAQAKEFYSLKTNVIEKFQVKETSQGQFFNPKETKYLDEVEISTGKLKFVFLKATLVLVKLNMFHVKFSQVT